MSRIPYPLLLAGLAALVAVLAFASLAAGRVWVPFGVWFAQDDPRSAIIFACARPARCWA